MSPYLREVKLGPFGPLTIFAFSQTTRSKTQPTEGPISTGRQHCMTSSAVCQRMLNISSMASLRPWPARYISSIREPGASKFRLPTCKSSRLGSTLWASTDRNSEQASPKIWAQFSAPPFFFFSFLSFFLASSNCCPYCYHVALHASRSFSLQCCFI